MGLETIRTTSLTALASTAAVVIGLVVFSASEDFDDSSVASVSAFQDALLGLAGPGAAAAITVELTKEGTSQQGARHSWPSGRSLSARVFTAAYRAACASSAQAAAAEASLRAASVDVIEDALNARLSDVGVNATVQVLSHRVGGGLGEDIAAGFNTTELGVGNATAATSTTTSPRLPSTAAVVCGDVDRYADAALDSCLPCAALHEVDAAGTGCALALGPALAVAAGAVACLALLCCGLCVGRRWALPPPWLWLLDACDARRRGAPCRCGRGAGCRCDSWKARFGLYYRRCSGSDLYPAGHWVLGLSRLSLRQGVCATCRGHAARCGGAATGGGAKAFDDVLIGMEDKVSSSRAVLAVDGLGAPVRGALFSRFGPDFEAKFLPEEDTLEPTVLQRRYPLKMSL